MIAVNKGTKVWIDHCDLYSIGLKGGKDDFDGLIDITHAGDLVTVSWNKIYDHWKGSLVGHSDSNGNEDRGKLRVTYHHNWIYNVNSRLPSLRFSTGHIYSNCVEDVLTSGVNSRMGAVCRVENNYFLNVNEAMTSLDSSELGAIQDIGNILAGSSTKTIEKPGSLSVPYNYQ